MPRYKPTQRNGMFIPVVFEEQIQPGTFEFALHHLVDQELDLRALDAKFRNDATGASAYDPRALLKSVLLAYSRALITSRKIEAACEHNVLFMALWGDARLQLHPHRQIRTRTWPRHPKPVHPSAADLRPPGPDRTHDVRHRRRQAAGQRQQRAQRHPFRANTLRGHGRVAQGVSLSYRPGCRKSP